MGMGILIPVGFLWDSHGNRSSFRATNGNGNGNLVLMGMGIAYFISEK